jgi:hypothetical protein
MKTKEQLRAAMPGKRFGPPPRRGPNPHLPPIGKNLTINVKSGNLEMPNLKMPKLKKGKLARKKKK